MPVMHSEMNISHALICLNLIFFFQQAYEAKEETILKYKCFANQLLLNLSQQPSFLEGRFLSVCKFTGSGVITTSDPKFIFL